MFSARDSRSSGLDSSPGPGHCIIGCVPGISWARHCTLLVPLSPQVYKWVMVNLLLGVTL